MDGTEKHNILLDTGADDTVIRNAARLGNELCKVEYVFVSHGHSDHVGVQGKETYTTQAEQAAATSELARDG